MAKTKITGPITRFLKVWEVLSLTQAFILDRVHVFRLLRRKSERFFFCALKMPVQSADLINGDIKYC